MAIQMIQIKNPREGDPLLTIEVDERGRDKKETLVFVHGLGGNLRQWSAALDFFETDYHVIALSLQGHGQSDKPEGDHSYSLDAYVQTVLAVLEQLDVKTCTWVGNSMGGVVGYALMEKVPGIIRHIITNGTAPKITTGKAALKLLKWADRTLIGLMGFDGYLSFAAKHTSTYDHAQREVLDLFRQSTPRTIITSHQVLGVYDFTGVIAKEGVPVTIIESPDDKSINGYIRPIRDQLDSLDHVRFVAFPKTGHVCNLELPEAYNQLVDQAISMHNPHPQG